MTDGQNFFDQPLRPKLITYDSIQKIATGHRDDYTACCFLDYNYFKKYCKIIATDLIKQQALDADPKQHSQLRKSSWRSNSFFVIIKKAKETVLDFSQRTVKVF